MRITLGERGNRLVIGLIGRFDAGGATTVSEALEKALNSGRRFVELDMSGVEYLSSAGIRVLLHHYQKMEKLRGSLSLTGVQERVERILEMAGLYDLLRPAVPSMDDPDHVPAATLDLPGWKAHDFALDSSGVLVPELIGGPCDGTVRKSDRPCVAVPFPVSTVAVGIGALGYDDSECRDRLGPFIAAGGIAAYRPAAAGQAADYVVYAEDYIPALRVISGLSMTGGFSHLASFECDEGKSIGISDLADCMLRLQDEPEIGFVLAAECRDRVLLACGMKEHVHAAFFPYHPLRLGFVKLKETVAGLFERELLDVVHIKSPVRLLRGAAWFSALAGTGP